MVNKVFSYGDVIILTVYLSESQHFHRGHEKLSI